jgi:hypothetical protein
VAQRSLPGTTRAPSDALFINTLTLPSERDFRAPSLGRCGRGPGAQEGTRRFQLSLIVPRIVLLVVRKTSTTVWVLILLFGTPTATTTLLTTLAALTSLLAALILTLILRHHYLPIGIS